MWSSEAVKTTDISSYKTQGHVVKQKFVCSWKSVWHWNDHQAHVGGEQQSTRKRQRKSQMFHRKHWTPGQKFSSFFWMTEKQHFLSIPGSIICCAVSITFFCQAETPTKEPCLTRNWKQTEDFQCTPNVQPEDEIPQVRKKGSDNGKPPTDDSMTNKIAMLRWLKSSESRMKARWRTAPRWRMRRTKKWLSAEMLFLALWIHQPFWPKQFRRKETMCCLTLSSRKCVKMERMPKRLVHQLQCCQNWKATGQEESEGGFEQCAFLCWHEEGADGSQVG